MSSDSSGWCLGSRRCRRELRSSSSVFGELRWILLPRWRALSLVCRQEMVLGSVLARASVVCSCEGWSSMASGLLLSVLLHFDSPLHGPHLCSPSEGLGLRCGVALHVSCMFVYVCSGDGFFQLRVLFFGSRRFKCRTVLALLLFAGLRLHVGGFGGVFNMFSPGSHYF
ncbi:hypothetical protein Bca4012_076870 [Brassica carinata]